MKHSTFDFTSNDGLKLFGRVWESEEKHPKGIVHLIHGLGEHSGRYDHIAEALTKTGYHMVSFDLRGHGLSEGQLGHAPSFDTILDDISIFIEETRELFDDSLPSFIYGHSLGGLLVINYGMHRPEYVKGVIATDPALKLSFSPPPVTFFIAKVMANLVPTFSSKNSLDVNALSQDTAVVKAYQDDPLVHDKISARLAVDMIHTGEEMLDHTEEWAIPMLLMHGTGDRITSSDASQAFAEKAGSGVTYVPWEGFYHEVHNDIGKEKVIEKMIAWLDEQTK